MLFSFRICMSFAHGIKMNLREYGFKEELYENIGGATLARITAVHRERWELVCSEGETGGRLKGGTYYNGGESFPTVGDYVTIEYVPGGDSIITRTLPRKTCFTRLDTSSAGHGEQAVAANFERAFILQSANHDFNPHRLERYLTLAFESGATPVVLLTKADLTDDIGSYTARAEAIAPGVCVIALSVQSGYGLERLSELLKPTETVVFLGSSGVGKSSLINAIAGEELMVVGEIREDDGRGRHTTTHRQLIKLKNGVIVIDTPGMRELGMFELGEGINRSFADVERWLGGKCRFRNCSHTNEPGCAVLAALESGELSEERWQSYQGLLREAKFTDDKQSYLREKQQWHKGIERKNREIKKARSR